MTWVEIERKTSRKVPRRVVFGNITRAVDKHDTCRLQTTRVLISFFLRPDGGKNTLKTPLFCFKMGDFTSGNDCREIYVEHSQWVTKTGIVLESVGWGTGRAFLFDSRELTKSQNVSEKFIFVYIMSFGVMRDVAHYHILKCVLSLFILCEKCRTFAERIDSWLMKLTTK